MAYSPVVYTNIITTLLSRVRNSEFLELRKLVRYQHTERGADRVSNNTDFVI